MWFRSGKSYFNSIKKARILFFLAKYYFKI